MADREKRPYAPLHDNKSNAPEEQDKYRAKLEAMTDEQLYDECYSIIWLSAYANNNHRSCYHWMCDDAYAECDHRGKVEGIYSKVHAARVSEAS